MTALIGQIMSSAFGIQLPFGFSFGMMIVTIWSIPLIVRLFKSIF